MGDRELLDEYVRSRSDEAFAAIVERYVRVVYASAKRQVADAQLSEDVTQAVFVLLARNARKIRGKTLGGWLMKATRFAAIDVLRARQRRATHEAEVAKMAGDMTSTSNDEIRQLLPHLDEAIARLPEKDRDVITLRYLREMSMHDVAQSLDISEPAAQKRSRRAFERLRDYFKRRGITLTLAGLTTALAASRSEALPANLSARTIEVAMHATTVGATGPAIVLSESIRRAIVLVGLKQLGTIVACALAGVALVVGAGVAIHAASTKPARANAIVGPVMTTSGATQPQIKVGILISEFNATGPSWVTGGRKLGYGRAAQALTAFNDPRIDRFAILEPGTAHAPGIAAMLRGLPPDHAIDGTNVDQLRQLDVIVSFFQWNVEPKVLDAMEKAVEGGTALLVQASCGSFRPGFTESVRKLTGMNYALRYYVMEPTDVKIISHHPLLKDLQGLKDNAITLPVLSGSIGEIDGEPLMETDKPNWLSHPIEQAQDTDTYQPATQPITTFYPLYVTHCGKGKVVVCQWEDAGKEFTQLTKRRFHIHCVEWLVGRPLD
jgi:RNA polymerase sigma factor (sigma-70 family)